MPCCAKKLIVWLITSFVVAWFCQDNTDESICFLLKKYAVLGWVCHCSSGERICNSEIFSRQMENWNLELSRNFYPLLEHYNEARQSHLADTAPDLQCPSPSSTPSLCLHSGWSPISSRIFARWLVAPVCFYSWIGIAGLCSAWIQKGSPRLSQAPPSLFEHNIVRWVSLT